MTKLKIIMGGAYRSYLICYVQIHASNLKTILTFLVLFYFILPLLRFITLSFFVNAFGCPVVAGAHRKNRDYE